MDAESSYNPMQDANFMHELDQRIYEVVDVAENRMYHHVNNAINQAVNYQDVREIADQAIDSLNIEEMIRAVVMNVIREIGLIDDNYRAHEPQNVDASEFDRIVI